MPEDQQHQGPDALLEFIKARHAEETDLALAATQGDCGGRWWATESRRYDDGKLRLVKTQAPHADGDPTYWLGGTWIVTGEHQPEPEDEANLRHIAYWDPERVLSGIAAERAMVHVYETYCEARDTAPPHLRPAAALVARTLRGLVVEFACARGDHPDYKLEWRFDV